MFLTSPSLSVRVRRDGVLSQPIDRDQPDVRDCHGSPSHLLVIVAPMEQRSLGDLGQPLSEVTFCVFDLETTGGSPSEHGITEIGAVKVRGGEVLGTFQTFVNPGQVIPAQITILTGITDAMVMRAPPIDAVLPTFLEFIGDAVLVGHNIRFDVGFTDAALERTGRPSLPNSRLDTLALARRLLADETPRFGLGALARHLRLAHDPCHRAIADALATTDLLHVLIERATAWGVSGLDDLLALPSIAGHPQRSKLAMTATLPRSPGVYYFADADGRLLYVGKATDLRSRVRSYFSSDTRRKVSQLLRETATIGHEVLPNPLAAELRERWLIRRHQPRFNRQGRRTTKKVWVTLTTERFARLTITYTKPDRPALGPMSRRQATEVVDALHTVFTVRRCTVRIGRRAQLPVSAPCLAGQIGVAACPCGGEVDDEAYGLIVTSVNAALDHRPDEVFERLRARMHRLASEDRFEEAADVRNRAQVLSEVYRQHRRAQTWSGLERIVARTPRGEIVDVDRRMLSDPEDQRCVTHYFEREAARLELLRIEGTVAAPVGLIPEFSPTESRQPTGSKPEPDPASRRPGRRRSPSSRSPNPQRVSPPRRQPPARLQR